MMSVLAMIIACTSRLTGSIGSIPDTATKVTAAARKAATRKSHWNNAQPDRGFPGAVVSTKLYLARAVVFKPQH
jgi:hypothetical protein